MKEINISKLITSILVLAIVIVGVFGLLKIDFSSENYKKLPADIHSQLLKKEYLVNVEELNINDSITAYIFVDLRSKFDFEKEHFNNAINIFAPTILEKEHLSLFKKIEKDGKTIILYSTSPQKTISTWYVLTKLGIENLKILNANITFENNSFMVTTVENEALPISIADFIKKSSEVKVEPKEIIIPKLNPKKVITVKKEKIEIEEGGC
ncbi:MAG TPA: rhodanese-like domain-containing protein [Flavobacteriaceae bacterium]|nr:rhodanese-like domain-containing protein [Flavobacteriaceae bacterium]HEX5743693.1 rhodanese-like domain-containing protein [Flavobacteriaceae bacterium]